MINSETKITKIESLSKEHFIGMMNNLLIKMSYKEVKNEVGYFLGLFASPISSDWHGFIPFIEKLSGNVDYDEIIKQVIDTKTLGNFHTTFIVSPFHISKGFRDSLKDKIQNINLEFLDRDDIIRLLDVHINDYWKHDDIELLDYEKYYCDSILKESELKKLKIFNEKYQKLFDIFIEPKINHFYEDKETKTPLKKNINIEYIINEKAPSILTGEPGTGKSTTLRRIGEIIIRSNQENNKKNLPIFISVVELFDYKFEIEALVTERLNPFFKESIEEVFKEYNITILVDSIDEFEIENQIIISEKLNYLFKTKNIKFILGTRSSDKNVLLPQFKNYNTYHIQRFNNEQIQQFINKFFINQKSRAEKLIEALHENRILEKLPITPLSLSLISILFEENDLEIPATITDIYENFNSLLLGKAVVSSRIEFIDISFKERILSLYALELLNRKEHNPMDLDEFFNHFTKYFESKTLPIKKGSLIEVLKYLVDNTGIIYLKNNKYVSFSHDSFMEFYAAIEIFKHQRKEEDRFVDNFFDLNWQNSAIFYAGKSKDMGDFLSKINGRLKSAKYVAEFYIGVMGAGYLLQALYQTDNKIRKETIDIALNLNIQAHDFFMKMAADDGFLFKSYKLPILWLINLMYFFENFNSITLREPLKLSFDKLIQDFVKNPASVTEGYKAFKVAMTLSSNRINEKQELEDLIFKSPLLNNPILTILADFSLKMVNGENYKDIKKEVKTEFKKIAPQAKQLLEFPASKLRFTTYDQIKANKKIKLVTEGKTDAEIIEHSFMTLVNGELPYWSITPAGNESGGASEVKKTLDYCKATLVDNEILIGIFDHDDSGLGSFNGLSDKLFDVVKPNVVKKHKEANIYAIVLPIPGEKEKYLHNEQKYNYFAIEHYFSEEMLKEYDVLKDTPIEGIYSIKDSRKKEFSKIIRQNVDPKTFKNFIQLFSEIDSISGINIEYTE